MVCRARLGRGADASCGTLLTYLLTVREEVVVFEEALYA